MSSCELPKVCGVTLTVRCIRSFSHRNLKNVVLHNVSPDLTTEQFLELVRSQVRTAPGLLPPFRTYPYDTFKIEAQAHGFKTNDPVINRDDDDTLVLKEGVTLKHAGVKNETEISFFKMKDYLEYKKNPTSQW